MSRPIAIYSGYNVRYPLGGHVLAELHNIVGLQRLGYDVVYVEESGSEWTLCYDPVRQEMTPDPDYGIGVLRETLGPLGLKNNWCFVDRDNRYHGLDATRLRALCRNATLMFGRSRVTWLEEFYECRNRIFIDPDPAITQFETTEKKSGSVRGYASPHDFDFHFTYGERIGAADCPVPTRGFNWQPTRPPVALELMPPRYTPQAARFTTVMSWRARKSMMHEGVEYGDKNDELEKFITLPQRVGPLLEMAVAGGGKDLERFRQAGWVISSAREATLSVETYCDFIRNSRGEFSVAKNAYVKTRCGWFSDRTAAYLASGKPAVVQDTGFSESIPCGEGLFAFEDLDGAVRAMEAVASDYSRHCRAARRIAEEHFDSVKVLENLLRKCGLPAGD